MTFIQNTTDRVSEKENNALEFRGVGVVTLRCGVQERLPYFAGDAKERCKIDADWIAVAELGNRGYEE